MPSFTPLIQIKMIGLSLLAMIAVVVVRADAPDSLADSLYREVNYVATFRLEEQRSVRLLSNGTYRENWVRPGARIPLLESNATADYGVPQHGTYVYSKTSNTTGTLTLTPSDGSLSSTRLLSFGGPIGSGTVTIAASPATYEHDGTFVISLNRSTVLPLVNISTRAHIHPGEPTIIGIIVGRSGDFLIRVSGPALKNYGVADFWPTPAFQLFSGQTMLQPWNPFSFDADNRLTEKPPSWDWNEAYRLTNAQAFAVTGYVPFAAGSKDLAIVTSFSTGGYTIVLQPDSGFEGGEVLVEVSEIP